MIDNAQARPAWVVSAGEHIFKSYKTKTFWEFVKDVIETWEKVNPGEWREINMEIELTKADLKDKKYATTNSKYMERRLLLRIPEFVHNVIRVFYPDYPMDRKFFVKFGRMFPAYRIPDKI